MQIGNHATSDQLSVAVLFLVFNRPDTTARVFEAIRRAKPPRLYIGGDGARKGLAEEAERVGQVRTMVTAVDWPCEVHTLFQEQNLGCKMAVSGAISWFFEQEEMGIILEDDCLPTPDFFKFCEILLKRFQGRQDIFTITGDNFQRGNWRGDGSYYFSKYNHCWGWASWRRAWCHYDGNLSFWPAWRSSKDWILKKPDRVERQYWRKIFDKVFGRKVDSWAYPWTACVWYHSGLTVTPNVNLVSNIGFGMHATHTSNHDSPEANLQTGSLGELIHPDVVSVHHEADAFVFNNKFGGKRLRFPYLLIEVPKKVAMVLYTLMKGTLTKGALSLDELKS